MPFPMVHYSVAHGLNYTKHAQNLPQFYMGVNAPDAYLTRAQRVRDDRNKSHLVTEDFYYIKDDFSFFENEIFKFVKRHAVGEHKDFFIGYGIHLLTDIFWAREIYQPVSAKYALDKGGLVSNETFRTKMYLPEMTAIDVMLYRNCVFKDELWENLANGYGINVMDLVTAEEIEKDRNLTLGWYDKKCEEDLVNPVYVTYERVLDFIMTAVDEINWHLI